MCFLCKDWYGLSVKDDGVIVEFYFNLVSRKIVPNYFLETNEQGKFFEVQMDCNLFEVIQNNGCNCEFFIESSQSGIQKSPINTFTLLMDNSKVISLPSIKIPSKVRKRGKGVKVNEARKKLKRRK